MTAAEETIEIWRRCANGRHRVWHFGKYRQSWSGSEWKCECKGYRYRGECKHVKEVMALDCGYDEIECCGEYAIIDEHTCPKCGETSLEEYEAPYED
jgi:hypothetical protein